MWDALRHSFTFRCPVETVDHVPVPLSSFLSVERLSGPVHPAVFQVVYACTVCGGEHPALAPHDELDHAPLAGALAVSFWDPMTGRIAGDLGYELAQAAAKIRAHHPLSSRRSKDDQDGLLYFLFVVLIAQ